MAKEKKKSKKNDIQKEQKNYQKNEMGRVITYNIKL